MTEHLEEDPEKLQLEWYQNVYQGDKVPQLTFRAVLMGGILGALMSISNLYTTLKVGWSFGVAITACVLSYVIWNGIRLVFHRLTPMSILENNCMQSTASAAGYSTGATIGTAFGALLLLTGHHIDWQTLTMWTFFSAALGVFLAVPMKRQMINYEQLPFPSGIAAATTLRSLYSKSREAIHQAYALLSALVVGALTGLAGKGDYAWQHAIKFKLPELIPFVSSGTLSKLPGFGFEPSALLIGAGMIVGMRVSLSMLIGSLILYLVIGPMMVEAGEIHEPAMLLKWSLWTGTALMVTSGLAAFALQWKTILRALGGVKQSSSSDSINPELEAIEVPRKWFVIGVTILTIAMALLQYFAFSISLPLGVLAVVMSFFLALVACRSTGETDITPIGPMGKLTQLTYGVLAPSNVTTNLMAASVTANTASSSADLLTDLKSGYLLGANPKQQFLAQCVGVFFGTVAVVPAWYAMIRSPEALEAMNPPSTNMWKAVAEAMAGGLQNLPPSAQVGIAIGASLGLILALLDHFAPKSKRFLPSAMGLGLSWVMPFANCFSFFVGALIAMIWTRVNEKNAEAFVVPTASGAVAGESLACAIIAIINAGAALAK